MRLTLPFLFLVGLACFTGCGKDEVLPDTGTVTGKVNRPEGVNKIVLVSGTDSLRKDISTTGTFEFNDMKAGRYKLGATVLPGFVAPAFENIVITGGRTMQAFPIILEKLPPNGLFDVTIEGKKYSGPLGNSNLSNADLSVIAGDYVIRIMLPKISGPDSINTATNPALKMTVTFNDKTWTTDQSPAFGALKIISFDPVNKRGNAVFSLKATSPGEQDLEIKDGRLHYIKFKP